MGLRTFRQVYLELEDKYHTGLRRRWADGKRQRIEGLLNDFLAGAVAYAAAEQSRREAQEKRHREWEAEQRRRWAEEQRRLCEESRWKFLATKIEVLERAERIERFVTSIRARFANAHDIPRLSRFLDWSQSYAARLRWQCLPQNLDAALSTAGLFGSESEGSED